MSKIFAIVRKELETYFGTPIAYIVLFVATVVFNVFFYVLVDQGREAQMRDMFLLMEFLFVFLAPILTMKLLAEERSSGTIEFLMTAPIRKAQIVFGKFLGAGMFFTFCLMPTGIFAMIMSSVRGFDLPVALCGYAGIWLEGLFFVSVGLLFSSMTRNQIIAAVSTYAVLLLLYFAAAFQGFFAGNMKGLTQYLSVQSHSAGFFVGMISSADLIYWISGIAVCLLLTRINLDRVS